MKYPFAQIRIVNQAARKAAQPPSGYNPELVQKAKAKPAVYSSGAVASGSAAPRKASNRWIPRAKRSGACRVSTSSSRSSLRQPLHLLPRRRFGRRLGRACSLSWIWLVAAPDRRRARQARLVVMPTATSVDPA